MNSQKPFYIALVFGVALFSLTAEGVLAQASSKFEYKFEKRLPALQQTGAGNVASNVTSYFGYNAARRQMWLGTLGGLSVTNDSALSFQTVTAVPRFNQQGIQSLAVRGDTIWAATSRRTDNNGTSVPTGDGLMYSLNGGNTWNERPQPLDQRGDTVEVYGRSRLRAEAVIVPQQNVVYSLSVRGATPVQPQGSVWIASWSGGIRRSINSGASWQRMVLPPSGVETISPNDSLNFYFGPQVGGRGDLTYLGFATLVASDRSVWVGTVDGVCRTTNADSLYPTWRKFNGQFRGLGGNWILALREQITSRDTTIWAAAWRGNNNSEIFCATYTRDGGVTWNNVLEGERLYDFAFQGDTVYAAGERGFFISPNKGASWITRRSITDKVNPTLALKPNAEYFGTFVQPLASGAKRVWAGSSDGTAISDDGGATWRILRASIPTSDPVNTYAYPNPFAPNIDGQVRLRYKLAASGSVTIKILDFSMNVVSTPVTGASRNADTEQEDIWNGKTDFGARVANGVYFYTIQAQGQKTLTGKILVIN
jgi:hypothetical protein